MFLDIHTLDVEPVLANEDAVIEALKGAEKGVYWIPGMEQEAMKDDSTPEYEAWAEKHKRGPRGFLILDPEGGEAMDTKVMGIGGAIAFLVSLFTALIVKGTRTRSFLGRFFLCVGIGIVVVLMMDVQNWNWMNYPLDWTRGFAIDHLGSFALLGIVFGALLKPAQPTFEP
jgi:hypothetical protein